MTKKDYVLIARTLNDNRPLHGKPNNPDLFLYNRLAADFADALAAQNPRFDRARFLTACGVES